MVAILKILYYFIFGPGSSMVVLFGVNNMKTRSN